MYSLKPGLAAKDMAMDPFLHSNYARRCVVFIAFCAIGLLAGCAGNSSQPSTAAPVANGPLLSAVSLSDSVASDPIAGPANIAGAKNETISFALELRNLPDSASLSGMTLHLFTVGGNSAAAFQVLPMP